MAKILAPNQDYTGISAGVQFNMGVGETSNPHLIDWFKDHGYQVQQVQDEGVKKTNPKKAKSPASDAPGESD